jgi:hypothetical protein
MSSGQKRGVESHVVLDFYKLSAKDRKFRDMAKASIVFSADLITVPINFSLTCPQQNSEGGRRIERSKETTKKRRFVQPDVKLT